MLIRNATLADTRVRDVLVEGEMIAAVGEDLESGGEEILDVDEKLLLPGMVDVHVHFREPGASHKETWGSGSRSAAAGGVTTVVDQPNTDPPTTDRFGFEMKERFANSSSVDFGINGGVTGEWDPDSLFEKPLFALGEVFLADSTGEMGIDTALFETALEYARKESVPVTVHAEDETLFDESVTDRTDADAWSDYRTAAAEYEAIERACRVAHDMDTRIHVAHTSTPEGVDVATERGMTCEATPHHLFLSREDLESLGTYGRMNPPLRSETRRRRLFDRLVDGTINVVATDHAPHTREEKEACIWDAPSGVPGVETALPLLLEAARSGSLDYERIREVTATNPAKIFDLPAKGKIEPGRDADLVLFDMENTTTIRGENLHSKCGWTPFDGRVGIFPEWTMLRGTIVYQHGRFTEGTGRNVRT